LNQFIYPAVVGVVSIGIVIFLLGYVVPQVVSAFSQARTKSLAWSIARVSAGAIGSAYWGWPLLGRFVLGVNTARFASTLAIRWVRIGGNTCRVRSAMGMTALLEPLMIVVLGGVVLTIVMAVLVPVIAMNQLVQ
ncbi:type II secretion system inner membrane protein GspF, partial [Pseudomonas aeruginosa]